MKPFPISKFKPFWSAGILGAPLSRTEFVIQLKSGRVQDAWPQWSYQNWYFQINFSFRFRFKPKLFQHVFPIGNYLIYEFKSNDQKWVGIHNLLNRGQEGIFRSGSRVFKTALDTSIKLINDQYLLILTVTENEAMSFDCHDLKEEEASSARQKQRSCPFSILDLRTSRSSFWTQGDIMPGGEGVTAINAGSCGAERRKILYFDFWKWFCLSVSFEINRDNFIKRWNRKVQLLKPWMQGLICCVLALNMICRGKVSWVQPWLNWSDNSSKVSPWAWVLVGRKITRAP